jgi:thiol:disulfide interchange protein DsbC
MLRTRLFLLLLLLPLAAVANEAQIRKALESKLGDAKIERVQPGPMPGLWEVHVRTGRGVRVLYTDATASHVIDGRIIDTRTDRDLTEERQRELNAIKFESLPLDQAVKVQRGNGRRILVMFSDPYCPYCVKFEKTLQQINDITVYVFMYPVIRPQNADHSKAVWCSPDRAKAWLDLALHHKPPTASPGCDNPVQKNIELGHSLGVEGTPTLVLVNGERVSAGLAVADLAAAMDKATKTPKKR